MEYQRSFQQDCIFWDHTGLIYDGYDCINNQYICGKNIGNDQGNKEN